VSTPFGDPEQKTRLVKLPLRDRAVADADEPVDKAGEESKAVGGEEEEEDSLKAAGEEAARAKALGSMLLLPLLCLPKFAAISP
jgi:hypothetical protein